MSVLYINKKRLLIILVVGFSPDHMAWGLNPFFQCQIQCRRADRQTGAAHTDATAAGW